MNLVRTKNDLEKEYHRVNKKWIQKIDSIDNATRKYVLVFEGLIFECVHEQDVAARLIRDYAETD
ncbi:MAG: hypothetical protein E6936_16295, partial [Clostridium perfringens]|nr:hypothetical protein [Clostridium perfringens]